MNNRDPRKDPMAGDVLKSLYSEERFVVTFCDSVSVAYCADEMHIEPIEYWRQTMGNSVIESIAPGE